MHCVDEVFGMALECAVHVDLIEVKGGGDLIDDGKLFFQDGLVDPVFAGACDPAGAADEEFLRGIGGLELGDEPAVIGFELGLMGAPVLRFGIVGAEHEDDDGGLEIEGGLEGGLKVVGFVSVAEEGGAADTEIADGVIGRTEHALELRGIGPAPGGAYAGGDAIADAGDIGVVGAGR